VSNGEIWRAYENKLAKSDRNDLWRFYREYPGKETNDTIVEFDARITALSVARDGGIWIGSGKELFRLFDDNLTRIGQFQTDIVRLREGKNEMNAFTTDGQRYHLIPNRSEYDIKLYRSSVLAWDRWEDEEATVLSKNGRLFIRLEDRDNSSEWPLLIDDDQGDERCARHTQVLYLAENRLLLLYDGQLYNIEAKAGRFARLNEDAMKVLAISKDGKAAQTNRIYIATVNDVPFSRPRLETWTYQLSEGEAASVASSAASVASDTSATEISMPKFAK
jgi:hypothetical protein